MEQKRLTLSSLNGSWSLSSVKYLLKKIDQTKIVAVL